jgi:hypothetical protein
MGDLGIPVTRGGGSGRASTKVSGKTEIREAPAASPTCFFPSSPAYRLRGRGFAQSLFRSVSANHPLRRSTSPVACRSPGTSGNLDLAHERYPPWPRFLRSGSLTSSPSRRRNGRCNASGLSVTAPLTELQFFLRDQLLWVARQGKRTRNAFGSTITPCPP